MNRAQRARAERVRDEEIYAMRCTGLTPAEIAQRRVDVTEHQVRQSLERQVKRVMRSASRRILGTI